MVGVGSRSPDLQRSHVGLEESSSHRLGSYLVYLRGEFCRGIWVVFGIVGNTKHSFQTLEKAFRLDLDVFVFVLFSPDRLKLCKHLTWHEMFFFFLISDFFHHCGKSMVWHFFVVWNLSATSEVGDKLFRGLSLQVYRFHSFNTCKCLKNQFVFQLISFKLRVIHLFWGRDCLPDKWFMWDWCCSIVGIFFAMISSKHDFLRERCWLN